LYTPALVVIFVVAVVIAGTLLAVDAPYGRHHRKGWGPGIQGRWGWMLMESPAVLVPAWFFVNSGRSMDAMALVFFTLWQLHYLYRAAVYPWLLHGGGRPMPLAVLAMALLFNVWNGYLNGYGLYVVTPARELSWLGDPRFVLGCGMFLGGMALNHHSDGILLRLREPGSTGYFIPRGGLFRWVTAPNYLGELVQWCGWALLTWSLGGLAFAVFTAANLVPRALANHRWYRGRFPDYPEQRKAILPYLL